jgi:limonene-1,2-epoxide hydrolase
VKIPAVQVVTVEGGKIKEKRHYFDMMGMLQQLGAIPQS